MIRRPPRSTLSSSSAASDVYKRQHERGVGKTERNMRGRARPQNHRTLRMGLGILRGDKCRFASEKNSGRHASRFRKMVTERRVGRNKSAISWVWTVILHAIETEMFRVRRCRFVRKCLQRCRAEEERSVNVRVRIIVFKKRVASSIANVLLLVAW